MTLVFAERDLRSELSEIVVDRSSCFATNGERRRLFSRALDRLLNWYVQSAERRSWEPLGSFAWPTPFAGQLPDDFMRTILGFYAVEQYAPDYSSQMVHRSRGIYARNQFYLRWGFEESRHADAWAECVIRSGYRDRNWLSSYTDELRAFAWKPPVESIAEEVFYSIIQERATNEIYQRTANRADSLGAKALAVVARRVATDEAAHYAFFLEMGRLLLFLFPDESLGALSKVLKTFTMPAADIIDDYDVFVDALYRERLFGRVIYAREVVRSVLSATKTHLDRDEERTLTLDIESLRDVVLRITDVRYGQT